MPELITVFFPKKGDPGFRKAIVSVDEQDYFIKLGAKRTMAELTQIATVTDEKTGSK